MSEKARRFTIAIAILVVLQTLFLVWMISGRVSLLHSANVVTLQTEPVDPRDMFRGDYVRLAYGISRISLDGLKGDKDFKTGDQIYVELKSAGETWLATATYKEPHDPAAGNQIIRGKVDYVQKDQPRVTPLPGGNDMLEKPCGACTSLNVTYGIESYFIPEGTGGDLEKAGNARRLSVDVALGKDGEAAIKGLRLDGKAIYEEPLFRRADE